MALTLDFVGTEPTQAHADDAGIDLYSTGVKHIPSGAAVPVGTGTILAIPPGYFGMLVGRSGLGTKHGIVLANSVGIIDSGYRGEIIAVLRNQSDAAYTVNEGERIAQIIIVPFAQVKLNRVGIMGVTERGAGGFGSSGKQ